MRFGVWAHFQEDARASFVGGNIKSTKRPSPSAGRANNEVRPSLECHAVRNKYQPHENKQTLIPLLHNMHNMKA